MFSCTGCNKTSSFLGIGKKTAWAAWQGYPDLTEALLTLSDDPTLLTLDSIHMARFECWAVVMYSKCSGCSRVNDVRRQVFTHGTRTLNHTHPHTHTGNPASTCKASSVPGRLHLETSKAATPRCPGRFSVYFDKTIHITSLQINCLKNMFAIRFYMRHFIKWRL